MCRLNETPQKGSSTQNQLLHTVIGLSGAWIVHLQIRVKMQMQMQRQASTAWLVLLVVPVIRNMDRVRRLPFAPAVLLKHVYNALVGHIICLRFSCNIVYTYIRESIANTFCRSLIRWVVLHHAVRRVSKAGDIRGRPL